jgi:hypothetical protein
VRGVEAGEEDEGAEAAEAGGRPGRGVDGGVPEKVWAEVAGAEAGELAGVGAAGEKGRGRGFGGELSEDVSEAFCRRGGSVGSGCALSGETMLARTQRSWSAGASC